MKKIKKFIRIRWYEIIIITILLLTLVLRFYNYDNRWGLAYDQARDAIVGKEALRQSKIPSTGPFSQAGSFVMGPVWYWGVALATAIYPRSVLTPWVILTLSYVFVVFIIMATGREIGGKSLSIISGLFTAVSTAQIMQSTNLTNPSGIAILSASSLYFTVKYIKTGKKLYAFLFPMFISLAINVHLQAAGLLFLIPPALILKKPNLKKLFVILAGLIIPAFPLIVFDLTHNFYDTRSMIDYIRYGQYNIYVPNRWLTYVGIFWPRLWARIIGGQLIAGYFLIILLSIATVFAAIKKDIQKVLFAVIVSFICIFIMLRFFKGERYDSYHIFLHPFVLLLTAWVCTQIYKYNRILGIVIVIAIFLGSMKLDIDEIGNSTNYTSIQAEYWKTLLAKNYPGKNFLIYDYMYKSRGKSLPLVLYMSNDNLLNEKGYKIGFGSPPVKERLVFRQVKGNEIGYELWDLNSSSSAQLEKHGWIPVNASDTYRGIVEWHVRKSL
jgi:hypothetical protein